MKQRKARSSQINHRVNPSKRMPTDLRREGFHRSSLTNIVSRSEAITIRGDGNHQPKEEIYGLRGSRRIGMNGRRRVLEVIQNFGECLFLVGIPLERGIEVSDHLEKRRRFGELELGRRCLSFTMKTRENQQGNQSGAPGNDFDPEPQRNGIWLNSAIGRRHHVGQASKARERRFAYLLLLENRFFKPSTPSRRIDPQVRGPNPNP